MVRRGDEAAFAELFRRYHQLVYRYCRSLVRDEHDAQDALQITFTNALLALRSRRLDAPLRPWLLRIAHNESISLVRRRRPDVELPAETRAGHVDLRAVDASDDAAAERERLALLLADLRELPERQRGALVMREMSGFSHYEIALSLGITVGAAKQTILEARRGLMEMAEGRSMECEEVQRIVSDGDRRLLRARRIRGHLRDCAVCSAFAAAIPERSADMLVLWPMLPALTAGAVLRSVGAQATAAGHGGGGGVAAAGTKAGAIGLTTKAVAAGAVAAAVIGGLVIAQQSGTTPAKHLIASAPRSSGTPPAPAGQSSPARHGRVTPDRHQRAGPGKPTVKSTAGVSTSSVAPVSNHAQDQRQAQTPRFSRTIASPQAPAGSKPTGVTHTSPASSSPTVTQPPRTSNPTGSTTTTAPAVGAHPPASSSTVTTTPATTTTGSTTTRTSTTSTKTSTTPTTATSPSTTPTTTGPSQPLLGLTVTLGITTPSLPPLLPGGHFSP